MGNQAQRGGALFVFEAFAYPRVMNTLFWGDSAAVSPEIYLDTLARPDISFSVTPAGWEGPGNIYGDPLFRDIANGDYRLMATACGDSLNSPCIDGGSPTDYDSLLSCSWGLGTNRSDIGAHGGGFWVVIGIEDEPIALPQSFSLTSLRQA